MTDFYTPPNLTGYNQSPPANDGTQTAPNLVNWDTHTGKIGDPLKDFSESINTQLTAAFADIESLAANIAELKAITPNSSPSGSIFVQGYNTPNDGGGGVYFWDNTSTVADNGGSVIISNAGGTGRWLLFVTGSAVDLRQFGATTGSADNTTFIQNALTSGFDITGEGEFITTNVTMVSNQDLFGPRSFELKLKDGTDDDLLTLDNITGSKVRGMTLNGNKANQTPDGAFVGVRIRNGCTDCVVEQVKVEETSLTGIHSTDNFRTKYLNNYLLNNGTELSVNSGDAIFLNRNTDDLADGNDIENPARIGIVLKGDKIGTGDVNSGAKITNNTVRSSGENAYSMEDGVEDATMSHNKCFITGTSAFASTTSGMVIGESSLRCELISNDLNGVGGIGIELTNGPQNITIRSNIINSPGARGIFCNTTDFSPLLNIIIDGNFIDGGNSNGIEITTTATLPFDSANLARSIKITNNTVNNSSGVGIIGTAMDAFTINNNTVDGSTSYGVRVLSSVNGSIDGNDIIDTGFYGIASETTTITNDRVSIKNNTITSATTFSIALDETDNHSIMGNTCRLRAGGTVTTIAIRAFGGGSANVIVGNDTNGIATGVNVTGNTTDIVANNYPADNTYTITNDLTDRTYNADTIAIAELADVVATLAEDLGLR